MTDFQYQTVSETDLTTASRQRMERKGLLSFDIHLGGLDLGSIY